MPSSLVKKAHSVLADIFNISPPSVTILKNDKAKFEAAFRLD
jgi:hypothetical protein